MKLHILLLIGIFIWSISNRVVGIVKALNAKDYSKLKFELFFTGLAIAVFLGVLCIEYCFKD